jgi:hypothetical protein
MSHLRTRQELMEEMIGNIVDKLEKIEMNDKIRTGKFMGGKLEKEGKMKNGGKP